MNQGDVFDDVAFLFSPDVVYQVQQRKLGDKSFFRVQESAPGSQLAVTETVLGQGIVISYACEIDRVLRRIKKGAELDPSDVVTMAIVYPITEFDKAQQHNIRRENTGRYLLIEPSTISPERVIDFSSLQTMPMIRLLRNIERRPHGLNADGRSKLLVGLAYHLGNEDRQPGEDEPDLLQESLVVARQIWEE